MTLTKQKAFPVWSVHTSVVGIPGELMLYTLLHFGKGSRVARQLQFIQTNSQRMVYVLREKIKKTF